MPVMPALVAFRGMNSGARSRSRAVTGGIPAGVADGGVDFMRM